MVEIDSGNGREIRDGLAMGRHGIALMLVGERERERGSGVREWSGVGNACVSLCGRYRGIEGGGKVRDGKGYMVLMGL